MIFRQLFDHVSCTYTYLIADETSLEAVLVDPVFEHVDNYLRLLNELNLTLIIAMDTHTHADHLSALGELRKQTACQTMLGQQSRSVCVDKTFTDGEVIKIGSLDITALHTPGHTDDSYSFMMNVKSQYYLLTGDTLLIRGSGRTDFQQGDALAQYDSIHKKLLSYPNDTLIYPGHDYRGWSVTTVAEEKANNPRLQVKTAKDYANIMDNLNLPTPKLMDIAVPINQACGEGAGK